MPDLYSTRFPSPDLVNSLGQVQVTEVICYKPTKSSGIYPKSDPLKEWSPVKSKCKVKV